MDFKIQKDANFFRLYVGGAMLPALFGDLGKVTQAQTRIEVLDTDWACCGCGRIEKYSAPLAFKQETAQGIKTFYCGHHGWD